MKLAHPNLAGQLRLNNEKPCVWVIESPEDFSSYTQELFRQCDGEEGRFVLSEEEKEKEISKYSELSGLAAGEEMYMRTQEMKNNLLTYFLELEHASSYILETDAELDITAIFKALGVRFSDYADDYIGNLNQYIKIMAELMHKKVIVLVNIGSFVSEENLRQIVQNAVCNEISLLMIENVQRELKDWACQYIIDKDRCEMF